MKCLFYINLANMILVHSSIYKMKIESSEFGGEGRWVDNRHRWASSQLEGLVKPPYTF